MPTGGQRGCGGVKIPGRCRSLLPPPLLTERAPEVPQLRTIRADRGAVTVDQRALEPTPRPGEALIRPLRLGIGAADLAVAGGRLPFVGVMGHQFVGVVERVEARAGRDDAKRWTGKRVVGSINVVCGACELCKGGLSTHCRARAVMGLHARDGCFADRFTLPLVNLFEVPKGVDDDAAVFAEPLASVIHAGQMLRIEGKPYVTVIGDGVGGLLAAQVMARLNASVRLLGRVPEKFTLCEKWGIKHRHVDDVGRRQDQDVVVDCSGTAEGLTLAMQLVRPRGKIVLRTIPAPVPDLPVGAGQAVDLTPAVVNELELIGARCGPIPEALAMLAKGQVEVPSLITARMKLADGVAALRKAAEPAQIRVVMDL